MQFKQAKHPIFWICNGKCKSGCGASLADYTHCNRSKSDQHSCVYKLVLSFSCAYHRSFRYRAIFDMIDMPMSWPVDVNYHEAKAFCCWKGPKYRLLTEAEHNRLRGDQVSN